MTSPHRIPDDAITRGQAWIARIRAARNANALIDQRETVNRALATTKAVTP